MKSTFAKVICLMLVLCFTLLCTGCGKKVHIRETLVFGHYPQTAEGTDSTPIEWTVLDVKGSRALVISKYALDAKPFDSTETASYWNDSEIRAWLNNDFLNAAFSEREQRAIFTTTVGNGYDTVYEWYGEPSREDTKDKIFLLSYSEANQYLWVDHPNAKKDATENYTGRAAPTEYAIANGGFQSHFNKTTAAATGKPRYTCYWWLRSPGMQSVKYPTVAVVHDDGSLNSSTVGTTFICVRPAFWVDLNSGIFQ